MLDKVSQLVALAVAVAVIAAILYAAFGQRFHFVITITQGEPRVTKGKVHGDFLDTIREMCQEYGIASGWIGGVMRGKTISLRFSRSIPGACQQRLRNVWIN